LDPNLSEEEQRLLGWLRFNPDAQRRRSAEAPPPFDPNRPRRRRPKPPPPPRPGTIAAVICEIEHYGPEFAAQHAERWARHMFTPADVKAWLTNGLRSNDLELIVELRSLGIPPEAMGWVIRGETMLDRTQLRGYTAQHVARTLRQAGLLPKRSA
jgi:hypothetical protein